MIATMRERSFDLTPLSPAQRCTPLSVAAHTLYEKTRPDRLPGPGGVLVLDNATYEQITPKTCRISGAEFQPTPYQIKLEGVSHLGFRCIFVGGIRDPVLIGQIDNFLERVRKYTQGLFPELDKSDSCRLLYHVYGKNGVMGPIEPRKDDAIASHEIAILGEVVAPTAEMAHTIANNARASILHFAYPGQLATTGNFASPLSPHEQDAGAVFKFSVYHLVDLEPGEETSLFGMKLHNVGSEAAVATTKPVLSDDKYKALENGKLAPLTPKAVPQSEATIAELACIVRSKNSGPFEITFDIMFDAEDTYQRVKAADVLTNDTIKSLFHISDNDILTNTYFDPAFAWKCTLKRPWAQGSIGERDTLGTQQHAPLLCIKVPPASHKPLNRQLKNGTTNGHNVHNDFSSANGTNRSIAYGILKSFPEDVDRLNFTAKDVIHELWNGLELPATALNSLSLVDAHENPTLPSSYKIGILAQSSIALPALIAAQIYTLRNNLTETPRVAVPLMHATVEFKSERLYTLDGKPAPSPWGPIGGLHKTADGHVRVHDSFPNHAHGTLDLVGLPRTSTRKDLAEKIANWSRIDFETVSTVEGRMANYAVRTYQEWDALPQSKAISNFPIDVTPLFPPTAPSKDTGLPTWMPKGSSRSLQGLRVVEMSRVIAAPLCGKTLAAHGADVIWVTSPNLPDLPTMDRDFGRGKRTVHIDIQKPDDKSKLLELLATCDVFVQGFRPGALASYGLSPEELVKINPDIIIANMSAFGPRGHWSGRRGFDSLVQTCSGMNVSEAEHAGKGEAARPTPCQALDHAGGYFLAAGVLAAVYHRAVTPGRGSWRVDVSLAGAMKYLRSLGQYPGSTGFECLDFEKPADVPEEYFELKDTGFGPMQAIRHSATIDGCEVGWHVMPKPLGSDRAEWLC
jgi:hypothetical protein